MDGVDSRRDKEFKNSRSIEKGCSPTMHKEILISVGASLRTIEINSTSTLYMQTVSKFIKRALAGRREFLALTIGKRLSQPYSIMLRNPQHLIVIFVRHGQIYGFVIIRERP